ncbi:MAG: hypothetical protein JWQ40_4169 [Segetibacter sp.]|nr:hypothetical protein [Segetibacter sp.]
MNFRYSVRTVALSVALIILAANIAESKPIIFRDNSSNNTVGKQVELLIDSSGYFNINNIVTEGKFKQSEKTAPIFFLKNQILWARFSVTNLTADSSVFFCIEYPHISEMDLYKLDENGQLQTIVSTGTNYDFNQRSHNHVNFNFNLHLPQGKTGTYYFKINSQHPVELRMALMNFNAVAQVHSLQSMIMAAYLGVIISILLYNLFLYFATRDRSYIVYVIYLFTLAFAQLTQAGWSFKYFWPSMPTFNNVGVIWTTCFAGIAAICFAISFLHTATYSPKAHTFLWLLIWAHIVAFLLSFSSFRFVSYHILNFSVLVSGVVLIYVSAAISARGYRPALYYLLAWSAFLVGLIILVLRNLGFLPVNNFTTYVLYGGSAIEAILLSIALADKISILRREKEVSQAAALQISQENERLVKEQNIVLERKVAGRTEELQKANHQLTEAFKNLKGAQIQLVESEKMASLGQLTAGIAHEINNPINFVKSNIKPLQLDFKDLMEVINEYEKLHDFEIPEIKPHLEQIEALKKSIDLEFIKKEVESLMKGIENGAERTAEIVRGLRTFSRLDESVIKTVDIHEGIDSTLILLRSNIPANISVVKDYLADGNIECFPGKLNQVFMNIISNAVHAIKSKPEMMPDEKITISTRRLEAEQIEIRIKDTGKGMSEEVKQKIYDPFFTTKDVGEGTGLGMAIVFKIIQEHSGKIELHSTEGVGSEFIITLQDAIPVKKPA